MIRRQASPLTAEITGTVLVASSGTPGQSVEGAVVRIQADPEALTEVEVRIQLLYRRAWRSLMVTKGWLETPAGNLRSLDTEDSSEQGPNIYSARVSGESRHRASEFLQSALSNRGARTVA